jgi:hypothetical protein
MNDFDDSMECPHCHQRTPRENLNCIYCGESLTAPVGALTGLRYSFKGCLAMAIALIALLAFLAIIL